MTAQTPPFDESMSTGIESPMYSAFIQLARSREDVDTDVGTAARIVEQFEGVIDEIRGEGVEVRGVYDLTGFSADAAVLIWLRGPEPDELQWAQRQLRRTTLLRDLARVSAWIVAEITLIDDAPLGWVNLASAWEPPYSEPESDADFDGYYDDLEPVEPLDATGAQDAIEFPGRGDEPGVLETADDVLDEDDDTGALVSLFARIGVGEVRFLLAAEADAPISLIGDLGRAFGDDLDLVVETSTSIVGRWVATSELFEVLR